MPNRVDKIYICAICGNEVRIQVDGGGLLVCCNQEMTEKEIEE